MVLFLEKLEKGIFDLLASLLYFFVNIYLSVLYKKNPTTLFIFLYTTLHCIPANTTANSSVMALPHPVESFSFVNTNTCKSNTNKQTKLQTHTNKRFKHTHKPKSKIHVYGIIGIKAWQKVKLPKKN